MAAREDQKKSNHNGTKGRTRPHGLGYVGAAHVAARESKRMRSNRRGPAAIRRDPLGHGAPSLEAAHSVALEEIDQMAELCADHDPNTLLTVARELTEAGVRETYRVIEPQDADLTQFAVHGSLDEPHTH